MRRSGLLVWEILQKLAPMVQRRRDDAGSGSRGREDDRRGGGAAGVQRILCAGAGSKYPFVLCTSVNEEIVHGMPSPKRVLKAGDIVSIDTGVQLERLFWRLGGDDSDRPDRRADAEAVAGDAAVARAGDRTGEGRATGCSTFAARLKST